MKVIFLDIDGVLNWRGTMDRIGGYIGLCSERIQRFNRILDAHPDAKVVISSTWRHTFTHGVYNDFDELVALLHVRGLRGEVIGKTPEGWSRGDEIKEWLKGHPEVTEYVVLDDDTEGFSPRPQGYWNSDGDWIEGTTPDVDLRPRHVRTWWELEDTAAGLQDYHIDQAIQVLRGELLP